MKEGNMKIHRDIKQKKTVIHIPERSLKKSCTERRTKRSELTEL